MHAKWPDFNRIKILFDRRHIQSYIVIVISSLIETEGRTMSIITEQKNWVEQNPLRQFRTENGASIMDTASLLGVSMSSIQQWETGAGYPRSDKFETMAKLMEKEPATLMDEWQTWYEGRPTL